MHWLEFLGIALLLLLAEYCTFRFGWVEGFRKGWKASLDCTVSILETSVGSQAGVLDGPEKVKRGYGVNAN
jgi:hypothetical protein